MKKLNLIFLIFVIVGIFSCSKVEETKEIITPLSSWIEGQTKEAILSFIASSTDSNSAGFIPVSDRVAVFDNDGTLWSEQPMYFQLQFAIDRVKTLSSEHPEWAQEQPFKAILENDIEQLAASGTKGILEVVMATHAGMTTEEFDLIVSNWINSAKHPKTGRLYKEMVYQPMLELLDYLRANDFRLFIVSGGGLDFMRPWAEEVYGISKENIVGSSGKSIFELNEDGAVIRKLPELDFIDDKEGKPLAINKFIGRRPVFCGGNSDGDLAMMEYTAAGKGNSFNLYIHHTDSIREWAYDRTSHIGRLDKGLDRALEEEWTVVDMAEDWNIIYPFEKQE